MSRVRWIVPVAVAIVSLSSCQDLVTVGVRNECADPIDVSMPTGEPPEELEWITATPHEIQRIGREDSYKESTILWLRADEGSAPTKIDVALLDTPRGHVVQREAVIVGAACPA